MHIVSHAMSDGTFPTTFAAMARSVDGPGKISFEQLHSGIKVACSGSGVEEKTLVHLFGNLDKDAVEAFKGSIPRFIEEGDLRYYERLGGQSK
ncbi:unnamed protein product [Lactuca virosa]|uniref:Uncharacterized protein n=1 Tax=Lactuca virosa TaxID=75947 RepID=A0AAU9N5H6_9ASTR|nr:unnamed protein product [Lactuca virosa]